MPRRVWADSQPHVPERAARGGSRAREETGIGRGAASVSSAAVQLAKKIFGGLSGRRAMILGAGDVAELALECLLSEGVRVAIVANRTHERARRSPTVTARRRCTTISAGRRCATWMC